MPGPAVPLAVGGILLLAYMLGRKKGDAIDPNAPTNVINIEKPVENPPVVDLPPPPAPEEPKKTMYVYTIVGDSNDSGPYALAHEWTGQSPTTSILNALAAMNPKLRKMDMTRVTYVPNDPSLAGGQTSMATQTVLLPAGTDVNAMVTPQTPVGTNYPQNPAPGTTGAWRAAGPTGPALTPWQKGQDVAIPYSWGAPPASLASRVATIVGAEKDMPVEPVSV